MRRLGAQSGSRALPHKPERRCRSVRVTWIAKGQLCCRARTAASTIGLVVSSYLALSGTTAGPAAGQSSSEVGKTWSTQVRPAQAVVPAAEAADVQYVGASSKEKSAAP